MDIGPGFIRSGAVKYHPDLESLLVPIERVRPHPENPSNGDWEAIAVAIEVSGMYRPVYVQASTGYVLAGNTTYTACLSLDATVIPVIWLYVDHEAAMRIMLGDNELARLAIMDQGLLRPQIDALLQTELRLLGTGYTEPAPLPEPPMDPGHTVSVYLGSDAAASWFDLPAESDRERLLYLLSNWARER